MQKIALRYLIAGRKKTQSRRPLCVPNICTCLDPLTSHLPPPMAPSSQSPKRLHLWEHVSTNDLHAMSFSPCGSYLACSSAEGALLLFNTSHTKPQSIVQYGLYVHPTALCWISSSTLCAGDTSGLVLVFNVDGGVRTMHAEAPLDLSDLFY